MSMVLPAYPLCVILRAARPARPRSVTGRSQTKPRQTYAVGHAVDQRPVGEQRLPGRVRRSGDDHRARRCQPPCGRVRRSAAGADDRDLDRAGEQSPRPTAPAIPARSREPIDHRRDPAQRGLGRLRKRVSPVSAVYVTSASQIDELPDGGRAVGRVGRPHDQGLGVGRGVEEAAVAVGELLPAPTSSRPLRGVQPVGSPVTW